MEQIVTENDAARSAWPATLKFMVVLVSLTVCFDGFDSQLLSPTLPTIARDWNLHVGAFASIFALSTVGYAIGSLLAGLASDRIGRRITIIASIVLVGLASLLTACANGLVPLAIVRVITGLGIGGILASAFTAVPEFTPPHLRGVVIVAMTLCEPIGGVLSGLVCAMFLAPYGWHVLFLVGGIVPLLYAVLLFFVLPETPAFLAGHRVHKQKLNGLLARLGIENDHILAQPVDRKSDGGFSALFHKRYRSDTLLISASCFLWLTFLFTILDWLPTLFQQAGAHPQVMIATLTVYTLGSAIGAATSIFLVRPFGTRRPLLFFGCALGLVLLLLSVLFPLKLNLVMLLPLVGLAGFSCAAGQSFMMVLVPHIYDANHRGAGVGFVLGVGRLGTIAAAFFGALALHYNGNRFFAYESVLVLLAFICAFSVRNQVAPS